MKKSKKSSKNPQNVLEAEYMADARSVVHSAKFKLYAALEILDVFYETVKNHTKSDTIEGFGYELSAEQFKKYIQKAYKEIGPISFRDLSIAEAFHTFKVERLPGDKIPILIQAYKSLISNHEIDETAEKLARCAKHIINAYIATESTYQTLPEKTREIYRMEHVKLVPNGWKPENFTEDETKSLIMENPEVYDITVASQGYEKYLKPYLQSCEKHCYLPNDEIPKELKNADYWKTMALCDISYLDKVSEEVRTHEFIHACLQRLDVMNDTQVIILNKLVYLVDQSDFLSENEVREIYLFLAVKDGMRMENIPSEMQTEEFINSLLIRSYEAMVEQKAMFEQKKASVYYPDQFFNWIIYLDWKNIKISKKMTMTLLVMLLSLRTPYSYYESKFPKRKKLFWDNEIAAVVSCICKSYEKEIPKEYQNEENYLYNLLFSGYTEKIQWTPDLISAYIRFQGIAEDSILAKVLKEAGVDAGKISIPSMFTRIRKIPEQECDFYEKLYIDGFAKLGDIPNKFINQRMIDLALKKNDTLGCDLVSFVPESKRTQEFFQKRLSEELANKRDNRISGLMDQSSQSETDAIYIYRALRSAYDSGDLSPNSNLYMIGNLSPQLAKEMLNDGITPQIIFKQVIGRFIQDETLDFMFELNNENIGFFPLNRRDRYREIAFAKQNTLTETSSKTTAEGTNLKGVSEKETSAKEMALPEHASDAFSKETSKKEFSVEAASKESSSETSCKETSLKDDCSEVVLPEHFSDAFSKETSKKELSAEAASKESSSEASCEETSLKDDCSEVALTENITKKNPSDASSTEVSVQESFLEDNFSGAALKGAYIKQLSGSGKEISYEESSQKSPFAEASFGDSLRRVLKGVTEGRVFHAVPFGTASIFDL